MKRAIFLTLVIACGRSAPDHTAVEPGEAPIPATWRALSGWSPGCTLWIPPSKDQLPAPIRWQPCEESGGQSCRRLAIDWEHQGVPGLALSPSLWVDQRGVAHLFHTRSAIGAGYLEWVVGEVDGPLEFAMRMAVDGRWRCVATEQELHEGRFAIRLLGDGEGPGLRSDLDALLVGEVGRLEPAIAFHDRTRSRASWSVGAGWLVRGAAPSRELFLHSPDGRRELLLHSAAGDPDGLPASGAMPRVFGSDVFYEIGGSDGHALMAHDPVRGSHPLVRYPGDLSRGAGNLGSDGEHLVWTLGEDRPAAGEVYPRRSIVVADYTTDPDRLRPRRLRSDPNPVFGADQMRFAVGCGFAGRNAMPPRDLLIVRIADGVSWQLRGTADWSWGRLLGFTCDEAFATVFSKTDGVSIARVRLDSLGPGSPPD